MPIYLNMEFWQEDERIVELVGKFGAKKWSVIAQSLPGRIGKQCRERFCSTILIRCLMQFLVCFELRLNENKALRYDNKMIKKCWHVIIICRLNRWHNHLNPNIKKEAWTQQEELALVQAHEIYGNKWAEIAKFLPGRWWFFLCPICYPTLLYLWLGIQ